MSEYFRNLYEVTEKSEQIAYKEVKKLKEEKQELLERLKEIEEWEAELIKTDECWFNSLPTFNQELYDKWMKLQSKRKQTIKKAEGDNDAT